MGISWTWRYYYFSRDIWVSSCFDIRLTWIAIHLIVFLKIKDADFISETLSSEHWSTR